MYSTYQTRSICTIVFVVVKQTDGGVGGGGVVGGGGYGRRTMTGVMLADTAICLYMYVCKVDVQAEPFISCCFAGLYTYKTRVRMCRGWPSLSSTKKPMCICTYALWAEHWI